MAGVLAVSMPKRYRLTGVSGVIGAFAVFHYFDVETKTRYDLVCDGEGRCYLAETSRDGKTRLLAVNPRASILSKDVEEAWRTLEEYGVFIIGGLRVARDVEDRYRRARTRLQNLLARLRLARRR